MAIKWWLLELYNGKNVEAEGWDCVVALPVPAALWSTTVYGHGIDIIKTHDPRCFCYIFLEQLSVLLFEHKSSTPPNKTLFSNTKQKIYAIIPNLSNLQKDLGILHATCAKDREIHSWNLETIISFSLSWIYPGSKQQKVDLYPNVHATCNWTDLSHIPSAIPFTDCKLLAYLSVPFMEIVPQLWLSSYRNEKGQIFVLEWERCHGKFIMMMMKKQSSFKETLSREVQPYLNPSITDVFTLWYSNILYFPTSAKGSQALKKSKRVHLKKQSIISFACILKLLLKSYSTFSDILFSKMHILYPPNFAQSTYARGEFFPEIN